MCPWAAAQYRSTTNEYAQNVEFANHAWHELHSLRNLRRLEVAGDVLLHVSVTKAGKATHFIVGFFERHTLRETTQHGDELTMIQVWLDRTAQALDR